MTLQALTQEELDVLQAELSNVLGVEGSSLFALPDFRQTPDAHQYIRDVLLGFLKGMFRTMSEDSGYRYDGEDSRTGIKINYADPRRDREKGHVPAITLELGPLVTGHHAIDDLLGGKADGTTIHTGLRNGSAIIRCRASVKLEADSLASVIAGAIEYLHRAIEKNTNIHWIGAQASNPSSTDLQQTSPSGEFFVSNVVANVHYQETWRRLPTEIVREKIVFVENPQGVFLDD